MSRIVERPKGCFSKNFRNEKEPLKRKIAVEAG
jgi:hypothetical protein